MNMGDGGPLQAAKDNLMLPAMFDNTQKTGSVGINQ